jgi:hypothetical protein
MNTSISRSSRVSDMLDEAYAGPCEIARDPRPSRKVVSTLQVSRFMARHVHIGCLATRPSGASPSGQPPEFTDLEARGQVEPLYSPAGEGRSERVRLGRGGLPDHDMRVDPLSASCAFGQRTAQDHLRPRLAPVDRKGQGDEPISSALGAAQHRRVMVALPRPEFSAVDDQ